MTDSPSARYGAREQSLGSNTNTWGDTKLNQVIDLLDRGSKGYQALAVTGDATVTWTNYIATNDGQVATLKLTGTPAACTLTMPSKEWEFAVWNATTATITLKCSGGTGIAIPAGRKVRLFCDATDIGDSTPNYLPTATTLTNNQDLVSNAQLSAAVAAIPVSAAGLVLTSNTAALGQYLNVALVATSNGGLSFTKINAASATEAISGAIDATNLAATTNVVSTDRFILYDVTAAAIKYQTRGNVVGKWGLILQADQASGFTVAAGNLYPCDFTSAGFQVLGPASASRGDVFALAAFGTNAGTFNTNSLLYYGVAYTALPITEGVQFLYYTGATRGWIDL